MNTRYQSSKLSLPSIQVYQNLIIFLPTSNTKTNKKKLKKTPLKNPFLLYVRVDLNYSHDFRVLEQKQKNGYINKNIRLRR